ncbi:MAG: cytochrome P450 [Proteobacteria bacterium]|nr:cytochrome P450 [Pseudomonadota bacterium]
MTQSNERFDLWTPEAFVNPFPVFDRMRREAPVIDSKHPLFLCPAWLVSRYRDVVEVLNDSERFSSDPKKLTPEQQQRFAPFLTGQLPLIQDNMLGADPPKHSRLRSLVAKAFTPRALENMRPLISQIAQNLLDVVEDRSEINFPDDVMFPFQITVIAEILGLPVGDHEPFRDLIVSMVTPPSEENRQRLNRISGYFVEYFNALFAERRVCPRNDVISALVAAEAAGDRLSSQELLNTVFLLLMAGHETTFNLVCNSILVLLQHPQELAKLRANPSLIGTAIEEILRYSGPLVTAGPRFVLKDTVFGGQLIPAGHMVAALLLSANHDPEQFDQPDRFDITRSPNKHVAFGLGIHFCIGAPLARLEASVLIPMLFERFPDLRLAITPDQIRWQPTANIRALTSLPLALRGN